MASNDDYVDLDNCDKPIKITIDGRVRYLDKYTVITMARSYEGGQGTHSSQSTPKSQQGSRSLLSVSKSIVSLYHAKFRLGLNQLDWRRIKKTATAISEFDGDTYRDRPDSQAYWLLLEMIEWTLKGDAKVKEEWQKFLNEARRFINTYGDLGAEKDAEKFKKWQKRK